MLMEVFDLAAGTFTAPGQDNTFTVADDWTKAGGATFTPQDGTVTLDTTTTATITGDTSFFNLSSTTAGKSLAFIDTSTQTLTGSLTLTGYER